ncbi:uncharacterized protein [Dysidea avara]|uniref:uncharacterized protein n=1 Tax=Dysidea avara TaxID=196820 RepID=UPI00332152AA
MKCDGIISCCALAIVLLSVVTSTNGALPASLDVKTSITTKGDFGVVNKSESVAILAIFRANRYTIKRSVKLIDDVLYVETRGKAFRSVNLLNELQYGLLRSVSGYEGIRRFKELGEKFPIIPSVYTNSANLPWSCVVHPTNPDWKDMKMSLHGFGAYISFLQPCSDVPGLCLP